MKASSLATFFAVIHLLPISTAPCSFDCSISNNLDKVPFYTGPYCSNDPIGWAFGRFALIPHCGKTCSMLNAECNDNPKDPNGIMPEVLNRDFADCCDDYEPICPFCNHGLVEPGAYSTDKNLYRLWSDSDLIISTNFNATCAELETYYSMEASKYPDCKNIRKFLLTVDDVSSSTYLAGCECDPGPPTLSPVPSKIMSPTPSYIPTAVVTQEGLLCNVQSSDYYKPGLYYAIAAGALIVYFIPTVLIGLYLLRYIGVESSNKKKITFQLLSRFLSDLCQGTFIVVNAYAYATVERNYCDKFSFQFNFISASFALGMDLLSDIIAVITIRHVNINRDDDIESTKWKAMEFVGGWTNNFFCAIAATGAGFVGGTMAFNTSSGNVHPTINLIALILYFSITAGGYLFQPIYSSLFDNDFSFAYWCRIQCNPCEGWRYNCEYNSWRNRDGLQPHLGPVWGGAARVFFEYSTGAIMVIELLLNLESNIATIILLAGSLAGKVTKLLSTYFDWSCCD